MHILGGRDETQFLKFSVENEDYYSKKRNMVHVMYPVSPNGKM